MLTKREKDIITLYAKKYNVSSVFLFGSSVRGRNNARDIDLGVKGIKPSLFFRFYGELFKHLEKPVDLVDLSEESLFTKLVEKNGVKIYG
jgi:predicted nucleotidyltransferase